MSNVNAVTISKLETINAQLTSDSRKRLVSAIKQVCNMGATQYAKASVTDGSPVSLISKLSKGALSGSDVRGVDVTVTIDPETKKVRTVYDGLEDILTALKPPSKSTTLSKPKLQLSRPISWGDEEVSGAALERMAYKALEAAGILEAGVQVTLTGATDGAVLRVRSGGAVAREVAIIADDVTDIVTGKEARKVFSDGVASAKALGFLKWVAKKLSQKKALNKSEAERLQKEFSVKTIMTKPEHILQAVNNVLEGM
jgi:citrate lyase gamma subunit